MFQAQIDAMCPPRRPAPMQSSCLFLFIFISCFSPHACLLTRPTLQSGTTARTRHLPPRPARPRQCKSPSSTRVSSSHNARCGPRCAFCVSCGESFFQVVKIHCHACINRAHSCALCCPTMLRFTRLHHASSRTPLVEQRAGGASPGCVAIETVPAVAVGSTAGLSGRGRYWLLLVHLLLLLLFGHRLSCLGQPRQRRRRGRGKIQRLFVAFTSRQSAFFTPLSPQNRIQNLQVIPLPPATGSKPRGQLPNDHMPTAHALCH
jgi:hypothetical protein